MLRGSWKALVIVPRVLPNSSRSLSECHYDVLGVPRDATEIEIKSAFIKLSKKHHPDMTNSKDAHNRFVRIMEAYTVLSKTGSRLQYDSTLYQKPRHRFSDESPWYTTDERDHQFYNYTSEAFKSRKSSYWSDTRDGAKDSKEQWSRVDEDPSLREKFMKDYYGIRRDHGHFNPVGLYIMFAMLAMSLMFQIHIFNKEQRKQIDIQLARRRKREEAFLRKAGENDD